MTTSNPIDLAAEIVTSFVSNNSVPRRELAALIEAVHAAVKRLAQPSEAATAVSEAPAPAVSAPQVRHPGLSDLPRRRPEIQIATTASGDARDDAGAVPREMEPAFRLSHGRAHLRGAAVGAGEESWDRAIAPEACRYRAAERRRPDCRWAVDEPRRERGRRRPTGERRRHRRGGRRRRGQGQDQGKSKGKGKGKVVASPDATTKRRAGRARKAPA